MHLYAAELRHEGQYLCDKLILGEVADLLLAVTLAAREQVRNGNFQCSRQALQRRKRRSGFLVLDLGHVGPWYRHPSGKLPLAEAIAETQRADRGRQIQMSASRAVRGCDLRQRLSDDNLRFLFVERSMAAAAQVIGCTELNEQAVIATNDFP